LAQGNLAQGVEELISMGGGRLPLGSFRNLGARSACRLLTGKGRKRAEGNQQRRESRIMERDFDFLWVDLGGFWRIFKRRSK
jgi:hypothetical protein